ncbi:MAG: 4-hydroxyphenyl-beta-ketoacyl-CoA hydrolase [Betaproteobacteria bacterium RIFCSPLOWO2_02_67_12]|nr:MAG: 4-hydroxyphenyl-beta-ketoacyl-CoA hydrolase [Betaproteobacteria bacterium RIFCSPLOWO2_02_67_12]OGA64619.1 MAG: 4-hydroxyphenyl-beta-ketoacyl-CoA hydrolase [Betaproteobacteria bacterium RIFCSPLOWO2_12_FULL_67_28]
MNLDSLVAIDIHTHAEMSTRMLPDEAEAEALEARGRYFRYTAKHPTIAQMAAYYRERKMAFVVFTVDQERGMGIKRISNEEVAESAHEHADVAIPFASIDPARGRMGVREARRLIKDFGVKGFKFHPIIQGFFPNDRDVYPLYEVIAEARLPALFHTGQTGIGAGMTGGGGLKLKYANPMYLDDVAADFPDMPIVLAHPAVPWQEEQLSVALHKPNVYIDLSGWSPKYFEAKLVQYANTLLKNKVLFGSDNPVILPDRWIADFEKLPIKPEVRPLIMKENAVRLLRLKA